MNLTRDDVRRLRDLHVDRGMPIPICRACGDFHPCQTRQLALGWLAAHRPTNVNDLGATA